MLYIVSTPIGNLGDITARAVDVLSSVDVIYCEDTRHTGKLMAHLGIKNTLYQYHDHSADQVRLHIVALLKEGKKIALVSDAGAPLISDPGYKLIKTLQDHDCSYTSVPGASSLIAALQLSGLPSDHFQFVGFLRTKEKALAAQLNHLKKYTGTLIAFESAKRIDKTIKAICKTCGDDTHIAIVREITKKFEEVIKGSAIELSQNDRISALKGEIVLLFKSPEDLGTLLLSELDSDIAVLSPHMPKKEIAKYLASKTTFSKKDIYDYLLEE